MVVAAARSPIIEPRYFHSIILVLWTTMAIVFTPMVEDLRKIGAGGRWLRPIGVAAMVMAVLVVFSNILQTRRQLTPEYSEFSFSLTENGAARLITTELETKGGRRIALPESMRCYVLRFASKNSLQQALDRCEPRLLSGQSVAEFLKKYGFSDAAAGAMAMNFNEKEFSYAARLHCILGAEQFGNVDLVFFSDPATAARCGYYTEEQVLEMLKKREIDEAYLPVKNFNPAHPIWEKKSS
jgi:hypothetical protein